MKKILSFIKNNFLFLITLFLLAFIPLYPKIPIVDIRNTWVYIRLEDFIVLFVLLFWVALLYLKKISFKTPLTLPILIFWSIGVISTLHGILIIFPNVANVFPNVAFLSLLRHVEYMSLFFIAYEGMKNKKFIPFVLVTIILTLLGVIAYGFGQKYLGFPAYLTMNEEFAKGVPITLSALSRVPSTFAGHYDLAAYLVLVVPIIVSAIFGFKNLFIKLLLIIVSILGLVLLFMTVSRVSFFVIIISLLIVFFFQKRKLFLFAIPVILAGLILVLSFQTSLFDRFKSTIKEVDVLVDAKTGESIGHVRFVKAEYFKDKIVLQKNVKDKAELERALTADRNDAVASPTATLEYKYIPQEVPLVVATNISTGENLPQGTGYINLPLSPVVNRLDSFFYEFPPNVKEKVGADHLVLSGDFIVKKAAAYDMSFTTRFQGEWPKALEAFERNVLFGSGYGSVSLAVDNNYLRMLGETGLLGLIAFLAIILSLGIYVKKIWPDIDSKLTKSFILGFVAGVIGLMLNATLIDVFEASKIAFLLWILMGVVFGTLSFYQKKPISLAFELKKVVLSSWAITVYLFFLSLVLFSSMIENFFAGDDFTWLKWAADAPSGILRYFTESDGFFYRPGTKVYFYIMYHIFWLNQVAYHAVSIFLHFAISVLVFLLAKKIFGKKLLAFFAASLFLTMSGSLEMVYWIAPTGHLFNALFGLLGLLLFIAWEEKKKLYLYILSFISFGLSLLFHELGVVLPLLVIAYKLKDNTFSAIKSFLKRKDFLLLFLPTIVYLIARYFAGSHWLNGDYNYNFLKLPFNFVGNVFGYVFLTVLGPVALPLYEKIRVVARENLFISIVAICLAVIVFYYLFKVFNRKFERSEKGIILFGFSFFIVSLLPFIGLGNITSRYSYLASVGLIFIFIVLVKKLYYFLLSNGKEIAVITVFLVLSVYSLFQIIQLKQTSSDWQGAGEKTKKFFVSVDSLYENNWAKQQIEFHFVNVPIRYGDAWVFPVGIRDAVWFSFKNQNIKIFTHPDLNTALQSTQMSTYNKILIFNDDGSAIDYQVILDEKAKKDAQE
jgi:hypothetical protein